MKKFLVVTSFVVLFVGTVRGELPGSMKYDGSIYTPDFSSCYMDNAFTWSISIDKQWSFDAYFMFELGNDLKLWQNTEWAALNYEYKGYTFYLMFYATKLVVTNTVTYQTAGPAIGVNKKLW